MLVKNGDVQGLADAMMHLMADEQLRQRMSSEARKVVETYSEEVVMRKWVELFEEVVDGKESKEIKEKKEIKESNER